MKKNPKTVIQTAAGSSVAKMVYRLLKKNGVEVINVIRNK